MLPKWAWSGSREQFLQCGLRKFRHSKSSVYRLYIQFDRCRFVYDTWDNGSRLGRVMDDCTLFMTHCLRLNLQIHTISLVRTCRISSFCTVAWQLARLLLTRRIARSLGDSGASCLQAGCPFCRPTSSVKALKAFIKNSTHYQPNLNSKINALSFRRVCCCQPVDADLAVHPQVESYCTWAVVCQASQ